VRTKHDADLNKMQFMQSTPGLENAREWFMKSEQKNIDANIAMCSVCFQRN